MSIEIKFFILFSAIVSVTLGSDWEAHKAKFGLKFKSLTDESDRIAIWQQNVDTINRHNKKAETDKSLTYKMSINQFTHIKYEEIVANHMGYVRGRKGAYSGLDQSSASLIRGRRAASTNCSCSCTSTTTTTTTTTPKQTTTTTTAKPITTTSISSANSIDWRGNVMVGPIKNQQICGSCWAFSAISVIEGQLARLTGVYTSLSEQQLVDCDTRDSGCNGGDPGNALDYILSTTTKGIDLASAYPYTSVSVTGSKFLFIDQSIVSGGYYGASAVGDEAWLASTVAQSGPVSVCIYASSAFSNFKGGIFKDMSCTSTYVNRMNHCVTIVGYGTDTASNTPYWIVRNQWGTSWGEAGYMRLLRNSGNQICIATEMYMVSVTPTISG